MLAVGVPGIASLHQSPLSPGMVTTTTTTTTRFLQPVNGTKLETINCLVFQFTARALLLAAGWAARAGTLLGGG